MAQRGRDDDEGYRPFADLDLMLQDHERSAVSMEFDADVERRRHAEQDRLNAAAAERAAHKARKAERRRQSSGSTL